MAMLLKSSPFLNTCHECNCRYSDVSHQMFFLSSQTLLHSSGIGRHLHQIFLKHSALLLGSKLWSLTFDLLFPSLVVKRRMFQFLPVRQPKSWAGMQAGRVELWNCYSIEPEKTLQMILSAWPEVNSMTRWKTERINIMSLLPRICLESIQPLTMKQILFVWISCCHLFWTKLKSFRFNLFSLLLHNYLLWSDPC